MLIALEMSKPLQLWVRSPHDYTFKTSNHEGTEAKA
jgi:hypothetical protein